MPDHRRSLFNRIRRSATGHLRVAGIAVIFGMTAYGLIHILIWAIHYVENM